MLANHCAKKQEALKGVFDFSVMKLLELDHIF